MQMGRRWRVACIQFAAKVGELSTRPVAIGPVKAVCNAYTACVQGEVVDWANTSSASAMQVANVSKPFLRMRFVGLLRPAELGFEEFCIE